MADMTRAGLATLLASELDQPAPAGARALAGELARRGGSATAAVLYYGSTLRTESLDGVLDFYVLMDDVGAWPGSAVAHLANRCLPPNVGYIEFEHEQQMLRAKFAIISPAQFTRRVQADSLDTTIWARFCQPSLCIWSRSPADASTVARLIADAVITAASWAAWLGPDEGAAVDFWRALFARTYQAELRVEKSGRPQDIVDKHPARYAKLLSLAWQAAGINHAMRGEECLVPAISVAERRGAKRRWAWRERCGRPLNILRLLKAALTFDGAMDYVVWKIERHRGVRIEVTPWQRRFPLLAAPALYWKLRRQGILR
jgi:hypothetical protein